VVGVHAKVERGEWPRGGGGFQRCAGLQAITKVGD